MGRGGGDVAGADVDPEDFFTLSMDAGALMWNWRYRGGGLSFFTGGGLSGWCGHR